jgi:plastocyanin
MRRRAALTGILAALAAVPAASAQGPVVQAVDPTEANRYESQWSPQTVTITPGQSVTWSFAGTSGLHNVESRGTNWYFYSGSPAIAPPAASFAFPAPGTYRFVCLVHETTMWGDVVVTDASGTPPPPPPPPPLSEQPFPNDQQAPTVLDVADRSPPRLSRVRVAAVRNGARVGMRLSERARVRVRFKRAGIVIRTERRTFRKGVRSLTVRDPRMRGSYQVEVVARDLAGNRSRMKRLRVRVP